MYGMELVGKDAVALSKDIIGDKDPMKAKPDTIRALYGTDPVKNCVDVSGDAETAIQVVFISIIFNEYNMHAHLDHEDICIIIILLKCELLNICIFQPEAMIVSSCMKQNPSRLCANSFTN